MISGDHSLETCKERAEVARNRTVKDIKEFRQACMDYIDYSIEAVEIEITVMVMRMWEKLYKRTPKDTWYASNNWHISGRPSEWVLPFTRDGVGGKRNYKDEDVENREAKTIRALKRSRTGMYYINNNTPYIYMLEAGYSRQGSGFIHATYTEETAELKKRIDRIK